MFRPKLITTLKEGYTREKFVADLISGLVVGVVALPLAIAFAIASGVKPEQGLYTAVVAGFVVAALGGSRVQVSGPTGAFIVVVYKIVEQYGYEGLAVATLIAGFLLIGMGIARVGVLLKFIPYPVTVGFTSGIALIIFSSQLKDFFGLPLKSLPADFIEKWALYFQNLGSVNPYALTLGGASLLLIFLWPKLTAKVPGSLIVIILFSPLVAILDWPIATIGSVFGAVPSYLPTPRIPDVSFDLIKQMFPPAMTIALLGAIESLLSAVVADGMLGTKHRSNTELIAQGVGNILSPIFSGIPATGAIARTATNVKNGGRTPVAAMIHALTLLIIMMFFGPYAVHIPMPVLAAILIYVAWNMSEWRTFLSILRGPRSDVWVLCLTFLLTVLIDLTVAIEVGVVLSAFLFLQSMSESSETELISNRILDDDEEEEDGDDPLAISKREIPKDVEVFEVSGPLFYGAVERFNRALERVQYVPKVLILRMRSVPTLDATGLHALQALLRKTKSSGTVLILSGVQPRPKEILNRAQFLGGLGEENLQPNIDKAIERAKTILSK